VNKLNVARVGWVAFHFIHPTELTQGKMKNVLLRRAKLADMQTIESYVEKFRLDNENLKFEQFIVAERKGSIIGFGRIKPYRHCFELGCIAVLEAYRKRSIGSAIVKRLIEDFPSDDIWITTDIPEYFQRFGFKSTTDAPQEILDKIKRVCHSRQHPNAIIMLLRRK
jgi:N-acetylglutamate synthase-like GNAT family acetyltransferase